MDLKHHLEGQIFPIDTLLNADHCNLDEVGCRALHRGVYRHAFRHLAFHAVGTVNARDVAAAARKGFHIAVLVGVCLGVVDKLLHSLIHAEIPGDKVPGLGHGDFQVPRQAESRHAVEDAEIHHLGVATHVCGNRIQFHPVNGGGRAGVNIDSFLVTFDKGGVAAQVSQHAELNLRVVHRQDDIVRILGNERGTNLFAQIATDRNVLQVGISAGKATRSRTPLDKAGVNPFCFRVHQSREHRHVGTLHLLEFAVLYDGKNDGVRRTDGKFLQHGGVGTAFLDFGESQRIEQHLSKLFGAADVEFQPCHVADFFFQFFDTTGKFHFQILEDRRIHVGTNAFHLVQHLEQGHFLAVEKLLVIHLLELLQQWPPEAERIDRIFGAVFGSVLHSHAVERNLILATPDEVFYGNHLVVQALHHLVIQPETRLTRRKHPGGNEGIYDSCLFNLRNGKPKGTGKHMQVELGVVKNESAAMLAVNDLARFIPESQEPILYGSTIEVAYREPDVVGMGKRNVVALGNRAVFACGGKAQPHQIASHRIQAVGFRIHTDFGCHRKFSFHLLELFGSINANVGGENVFGSGGAATLRKLALLIVAIVHEPRLAGNFFQQTK